MSNESPKRLYSYVSWRHSTHNDKNIFNPFMFGQAKFIYFNMEEFNA